MRRYVCRPPKTLADLDTSDTAPMKLRDLVNITGWSKPTILAAVEGGTLATFRRSTMPGSPYQFHRDEIRRWLGTFGFAFHVPHTAKSA